MALKQIVATSVCFSSSLLITDYWQLLRKSHEVCLNWQNPSRKTARTVLFYLIQPQELGFFCRPLCPPVSLFYDWFFFAVFDVQLSPFPWESEETHTSEVGPQLYFKLDSLSINCNERRKISLLKYRQTENRGSKVCLSLASPTGHLGKTLQQWWCAQLWHSR